MASPSVRESRRAANDEAVRDAAVAEINAEGVDRLGPTAVARRAGLTTGAIYARYEDATEMMVDVWAERCASALFDLVSDTVAVLVDAADDDVRRRLIGAVTDPPPELVAALELALVSRRDDGLGEVVGTAVADMLTSVGAADHDPERQSKVWLALAIVLGVTMFHAAGLAGRRTTDAPWEQGLDWLAGRLRLHVDVEGPAPTVQLPELPPAEELDVDPTRARLLEACMAVIARVGVHRATATRIARRAGLTHGAIYGLWDSKEDLVAETVRAMTGLVITRDLAFNASLRTGAGGGPWMTAGLYAGFATPRREVWRRFRIESHLAARHSQAVADALSAVYPQAFISGIRSVDLTARVDEQMSARAGLTILGPLGLIIIDQVTGGASASVDWRWSVSLLG